MIYISNFGCGVSDGTGMDGAVRPAVSALRPGVQVRQAADLGSTVA